MTRPTCALAMRGTLPGLLFDPDSWQRLRRATVLADRDAIEEFGSARARTALAHVELLLTGWECPMIDAAVLDRAPALRAIVHAAGTVKDHVTAECFDRGVVVSSAAEANAIPVAEFTVAAILFAGKRVWTAQRLYRAERAAFDVVTRLPDIGNFGRTIGIVGASRVGRHVLRLLAPYDFEVLCHDPEVPSSVITAYGATAVAELDDLLVASDVVSLHAPALPVTRHMLDQRRLRLMRTGTTLVNTARGSLVDASALLAELVSGRLNAVLDVTTPEPLPRDSPLYDLPNVVLTPHLAGAAGVELQRLGAWAVDEVIRYALGRPFVGAVTRADLDVIA